MVFTSDIFSRLFLNLLKPTFNYIFSFLVHHFHLTASKAALKKVPTLFLSLEIPFMRDNDNPLATLYILLAKTCKFLLWIERKL